MRIGMIWAEARGTGGRGAIGRAGEMPWHLPEDLARFRTVTFGAPVIMGRRTWESLPEHFRPLPGRANFVVTRDPSYAAEGASVVRSLEAAVAEAAGGGIGTAFSDGDRRASTAWVMGGGELYRAAMPRADELIVTRIDLDVPDADTFAPEIGSEWRLADPGTPLVAKTGLGYRFERWLRKETGPAA